MQKQQKKQVFDIFVQKEKSLSYEWGLVPVGSSNSFIDTSLEYGCSLYGTSRNDDSKQHAQPRENQTALNRPIHSLCMHECLCQCSCVCCGTDKDNSTILIGTDRGDILEITKSETTVLRLLNFDCIPHAMDFEEENDNPRQKRIMLEPSFPSIVNLHSFGHGMQISLTAESMDSEGLHGELIAILPQLSTSVYVAAIATGLLKSSSQSMPIQALKLPEHDPEATILAMSCATMTIDQYSAQHRTKQQSITMHLILTSDDKGVVKLSSISRFSPRIIHPYRGCRCRCNFACLRERKDGLKTKSSICNQLDSIHSAQLRAHSGPCVGVALIGKNYAIEKPGSLVGTFVSGGGVQDPTIRIWNFICTAAESDAVAYPAPSVSFLISHLAILDAGNMAGTLSVFCPLYCGLNRVYLCAGTSAGDLFVWGGASTEEDPNNNLIDEASWKLLYVVKHTNHPIQCVVTCPPGNGLPGLLLTGDSRGTCRLYRPDSTEFDYNLPCQMVAEVNLSGMCRAMTTSSTRLLPSSSSDWGYVILVASENGEIKRWYESGMPIKKSKSSASNEIDEERGNSSNMTTLGGIAAVNEEQMGSARYISSPVGIGILPNDDFVLSSQSRFNSSTTKPLLDKLNGADAPVSQCRDVLVTDHERQNINLLSTTSVIRENCNPKREPREKEIFVPTPSSPPNRPRGLFFATKISKESRKVYCEGEVAQLNRLQGLLEKDYHHLSNVSKNSNSPLLRGIMAQMIPSLQPFLQKPGKIPLQKPIAKSSSNSTEATVQVKFLNKRILRRRNEVRCPSKQIYIPGNQNKSFNKQSDDFSSKIPLLYSNLIPVEEYNSTTRPKKIKKQVSKVGNINLSCALYLISTLLKSIVS
mmetsp:Transcript_17953/g.25571  ORF Transcript_17953/g.25571 Transcript_17953/m.25571 type:complete len:869 (+) Transcript_17953:2356-4962(+)